jgi:hypothetical protein
LIGIDDMNAFWSTTFARLAEARDLIFDSCSDEPESATFVCPFMDFGSALDFLRVGHKLRRAAWTGVYITLDSTDHPIYSGYQINLHTLNGKITPWTPIQREILESDWMIVEHDERP